MCNHSKLQPSMLQKLPSMYQSLYITELHHISVFHFVTEECHHLDSCGSGKCDCIDLICYFVMFGRNNLRYQSHYGICFGTQQANVG